MNHREKPAVAKRRRAERTKPLILLVDDDSAVRESLRRAFQNDEWEIVTASSGEAALDSLGKRLPDLVITDLRMAGVNGWDLLFHEMMERPHLPIFVISALPPEDTGGADRIATRFFQKPIDIEKMAEAIRETLHAEASRETTARAKPRSSATP